MRKTPIPTGLCVSRCYESLRRIGDYLKQKEVDAREEYGWDSEQAQNERAKWEALLQARAVIVREFDL